MNQLESKISHKQTGYLLILALIFGAIFFTISVAFIGFIISDNQVVEQRYQLEKASDIAEAGLNYYKWYLAHYPDDTTNGTGEPGPYVHQYEDPELGAIGEFSLDITSNSFCGQLSSIDVSSTGYTYSQPEVQRTVSARYARPTVAEYAYIINSNVWAGEDREIYGPYHSNQGIRMDGTNYSTVTSGLTEWTCTSSYGCTPNQQRDGVFTTTDEANPLLFSYPAAPINFTDLLIDLAGMKSSAQNNGGLYIPPSNSNGYRLIFNSNGTLTVRRLYYALEYEAYSPDKGWFNERNISLFEWNYGTYSLDADCPLVFVEDKILLEGEINQKVTVAVAGTDSNGEDPDIILSDNITYDDPSEDGLVAIAEGNVLVGPVVPNNMVLNGIFIAQNGRFGRNHYRETKWYGPNIARDSLTITGTIVSNGGVGTQWTSNGSFISGFRERINSYDRNLVADPPPLIPNTSDVYVFSEWREEQ